MKKWLFLLMTLAASRSYTQVASNFALNGEFKGKAPQKVFLTYTGTNGQRTTDSTLVAGNRFSFKGSLLQPIMATISQNVRTYGDDQHTLSVYLEPATMSIRLNADSFSDYAMKGSATNEEYLELEKRKTAVYEMMKPINDKYNQGNRVFIAMKNKGASENQLDSMKEKLEAIRNSLDPFREQIVSIEKAFFLQYPSSYVTAFQLRFHVSDMTADTLLAYLNRMTPSVRNGIEGKQLTKEYQKLKAGSPGSIARDFTARSLTGSTVKLSDLKGKYVLLDFWASWCVPCRKGNPHLKELYARYKEKGIEFIGVSDDDGSPDAWKKAVEKDGLPWLHVLRGLDWDKIRKGEDNPNDISELFGIHSLPTKILIDKEGKIIGRFSEEEGPLDKMLSALFDHS